jgi:Protein of unknown function (DUF2752)
VDRSRRVRSAARPCLRLRLRRGARGPAVCEGDHAEKPLVLRTQQSGSVEVVDVESRARSLRLLSAAYLVFAVIRAESKGPVLCPFRRITGRRCPLCGLTRGIGLTLRGQPVRSVKQHPAAPIAVPLLLSTLLIDPADTARLFEVGRNEAGECRNAAGQCSG